MDTFWIHPDTFSALMQNNSATEKEMTAIDTVRSSEIHKSLTVSAIVSNTKMLYDNTVSACYRRIIMYISLTIDEKNKRTDAFAPADVMQSLHYLSCLYQLTLEFSVNVIWKYNFLQEISSDTVAYFKTSDKGSKKISK